MIRILLPMNLHPSQSLHNLLSEHRVRFHLNHRRLDHLVLPHRRCLLNKDSNGEVLQTLPQGKQPTTRTAHRRKVRLSRLLITGGTEELLAPCELSDAFVLVLSLSLTTSGSIHMQSLIIDVSRPLEEIQAPREAVKSTAIALVRVDSTFLPGTTIGATHWVAYAMTKGITPSHSSSCELLTGIDIRACSSDFPLKRRSYSFAASSNVPANYCSY